MPLRFFSDQCVPLIVTETLRNGGYDVIPLRDKLPIQAEDPIVIAKAQELNAILVSINGDFMDIVRYPPSDYGGIIALRFHNHPEILPSLMTGLMRFFAENPNREFYRGKLIVVEVHRVRIYES
jgi:predicted nuclease of predicted toxin-antitoxin system